MNIGHKNSKIVDQQTKTLNIALKSFDIIIRQIKCAQYVRNCACLIIIINCYVAKEKWVLKKKCHSQLRHAQDKPHELKP